MKKLILLLFIPLSILGQDESVEAKILAESFIAAYNSEDMSLFSICFRQKRKKHYRLKK